MRFLEDVEYGRILIFIYPWTSYEKRDKGRKEEDVYGYACRWFDGNLLLRWYTGFTFDRLDLTEKVSTESLLVRTSGYVISPIVIEDVPSMEELGRNVRKI